MRDLLGPRHAHRFRAMFRQVAGGAPLSEAGGRSGLFSARDRSLLRLAETCGAVSRAAAMLAGAHEFRARVFGRFRRRMLLPLLVFALALFLLPLPALTAGRIDAAGYALGAVGPILLLAAAGACLVRAGRRAMAEGLSAGAGRLLLGLPGAGSLMIRVSRLELIEGLALLVAAGIPAGPALDGALDALTNAAAGDLFRPGAGGGSVSGTLRGAGALDADEFAIVNAAEQAGRLTEGLERAAAELRDEVRSALDLVSEWLPRIVYLAVAFYIAAGLLG